MVPCVHCLEWGKKWPRMFDLEECRYSRELPLLGLFPLFVGVTQPCAVRAARCYFLSAWL